MKAQASKPFRQSRAADSRLSARTEQKSDSM
jgi:hypothetical protein